MANGLKTWLYGIAIYLLISSTSCTDNTGFTGPEIYGYRPQSSDEAVIENGMVSIYSDLDTDLLLYGRGIVEGTLLSFTVKPRSKWNHQTNCDDDRNTETFAVSPDPQDDQTATVTVNLPIAQGVGDDTAPQPESESETDDGSSGSSDGSSQPLYYSMCMKVKYVNETESGVQETAWMHVADLMHLRLQTVKKPVKTTLLPPWLQILCLVVLLMSSGTFSGLNLGLMALDITELKILQNSGTPKEKRYAKAIEPLRRRGNYLLCTILLGNVLVNNTLAILMDDLTGSGGVAIISATLGIVVFGEIIPQAICSRYGLAVGARTILFTKTFMVLTFPLSFPISKMLDWILGEELGAMYNRDRLRELLRLTEEKIDLNRDEVQIITGALELSKKTVADVMTKMSDTFMIDYSAILDFETMSTIMKTGYTRIPVYEKDKGNVIALLNIKDLAFVDPDDKTPLKTVCKFYNHPINYVFEDTRLDVMLDEFRKGKAHIAFVQCVNNEGEGDPFYETLGIVTLEDVIEEIIQAEIIDETDTVTDNIAKKPRKAHQHKDFSIFNQPDGENVPRMSPQLLLATYQFLSTSVNPFRSELISEVVLQRLLKQNVVVDFRMIDSHSDDLFIYTAGKVADYFVLILQGRVEVLIGRESMVFEAGPFVHFGTQALTGHAMCKQQSVTSISSASESAYNNSPSYVPDFSVKALSDMQYLKIRRAHYIAARRATMMERHPRTPDFDASEDPFTKEWKKAMNAATPPAKIRTDSMIATTTAGSMGKLNSPSLDGDIARTRSDTQGSSEEADGEVLTVDSPLMSGQKKPGTGNEKEPKV